MTEARMKIDENLAFCSRGHRWVPHPIQRKGVFRHLIQVLEERERETFRDSAVFSEHKKALNLDLMTRKPYSDLPPELRNYAQNFINSVKTPTHLDFTTNRHVVKVLEKLGYSVVWTMSMKNHELFVLEKSLE
ncbi:MAG: hypothetical protein NUV57_05475 [archaeon]|nr:hypothetical protein [archaeon]